MLYNYILVLCMSNVLGVIRIFLSPTHRHFFMPDPHGGETRLLKKKPERWGIRAGELHIEVEETRAGGG
jgi:hypothetical protein